jgi:hypothetical protein
MSKSFRVSVVAGLVLGLSQVAFAGGVVTQTKDAGANTAETSKTSSSLKTKKKKKKNKAAPTIVVLGAYSQPTQPTLPEPVSIAPVATSTIPVPPAAPAPATSTRRAVNIEKTPGIHVSPIDDPPPPANVASAGQLVISEFRLRGPNGANDEYIEIANVSGADHTVAALSGSGYGIAASDGVTRCSIPNGTVIPNKGHYLCVNSVGYSVASYAAGNGTTATGDATYTTDIPDNDGIALFNNNSAGVAYTLANRLDAVGSTDEANTLYKEGTGYPALVPFAIDYAFYRDNCGKGGSITTFGACPTGGLLKDTNNNAADFVFVDTNATSAGAGQRLGTPGPENLSSPIERTASFAVNLLDPCVAAQSPPNRVRDFTSNPPQNSAFGTLDVRRTIVNNTGGNVTRLRFRVVDITTFPAPSGIADLRPRTSTAVVVTVDRPPCGTGTSNVTVQGTTLEQWDPPGPGTVSQPNGGGFNSSMSAGVVTLATPIANGASIDVRFLLGIQQTGSFKFFINVEALP